jgi:ABC-type sulfate transport system permease component
MSFRKPSVLPGFGLTFGFTTFFLSAIVLLPLAALVLSAAGMHWSDFVRVPARARLLSPLLRRLAPCRNDQRGVRVHHRLDAGAL